MGTVSDAGAPNLIWLDDLPLVLFKLPHLHLGALLADLPQDLPGSAIVPVLGHPKHRPKIPQNHLLNFLVHEQERMRPGIEGVGDLVR